MTELSVSDIHDWEIVSSQAFVPLRCTQGGPGFHASLHNTKLSNEVSLSHIRSNQVHVERTESLARRSEHNDLLLSVQVRSTSYVHQHHRTAVVAPGSAVLYEANRPYTLDHRSRDQELLVLKIPRDALELTENLVSQLCARAFEPSVPGVSALGGLLYGISREHTQASSTVGSTFVHTSTSLLRSVLRTALYQREFSWDSDPSTLEILKSYIHEHFRNPKLSVERLAAAHHISVRKLHLTFRAVEDTPGRYLREVRLGHAARMLAQRGTTNLSVASIARRVGFESPATFSRSFRTMFGCAPIHWEG
ncbi:AraC family transcriptional regulator [Yaniella flava]|uniref:AraC family transcriptional regulator n=1 Tax=Yaniella flava TaxID=287930 RepID=UPI0031DC438D